MEHIKEKNNNKQILKKTIKKIGLLKIKKIALSVILNEFIQLVKSIEWLEFFG